MLLLNALISQETVSLAYGWCSIVCLNYSILPQLTIAFPFMCVCVFVLRNVFFYTLEFQWGEVDKHLISVLQTIPDRSKQTQFSSLSKTRDQCPTLGMSLRLPLSKVGILNRENKNALKLPYGFKVIFFKKLCLL